MVLAEIIIEARNIKQKIEQLESYLDKITIANVDKIDIATKRLIDLFDKYRSHLILINTINNDVKMVVGDSELSIANTLLIVKTMKKKIDLLNNLIDTKEDFLDVFELMDKRDVLLVEHTTLTNKLKYMEWVTNID
jgi:hypothetical protein